MTITIILTAKLVNVIVMIEYPILYLISGSWTKFVNRGVWRDMRNRQTSLKISIPFMSNDSKGLTLTTNAIPSIEII